QVEYSIGDLHGTPAPPAPSMRTAGGGGPVRPKTTRDSNTLNPSFYNPTQVRHRRRTTKEQLIRLEYVFKDDPKPQAETRKILSDQLGMTTREVQIWFQNRRAKEKNLVKGQDGKEVKEKKPKSEQASSSALPRRPSMPEMSADVPVQMARRKSDFPQPPSAAVRAGKERASPSDMATAEAMANAVLAASVTSVAKIPTMSLPLLGTTMPGMPSNIPSTIPMPVNYVMAASSSSAGVSQPMKKKKKRAGNGDGGRYESARVYHAAFDGSQVPPVKAENFESDGNGENEQFNELDPANLPNFMMPGMPPMPYGGIGSNVPSYSQPIPTGVMNSGPFAPLQQPTGLAALLNGMLSATQPPAPAPPPPSINGLSLNTYGLQAAGMSATSPPGMLSSTPTLPSAGISPTDLSLGSVDPSMAFLQTLMALSQQSPPLGQPSLASPLGGSPPVPSMVSAGPIPGSAFSSYDAQSHAQQPTPSMMLANTTLPSIITNSMLASNATPDIFGTGASLLYSTGSNQTSSSGPSSPSY
ncbi:hypothetical protein FBU59_002707, partial [Linderina macrospora]